MGSISRHITPLVITNLGGGHTDTHIHTLHRQNQSIDSRRVPGLKIILGLKLLVVKNMGWIEIHILYSWYIWQTLNLQI